MDTLKQWLPFIIPIVLLQLALMVAALVDLSRRKRTRGPKWMWVIIIVLGELLGPLVYFLFAREE